jgi:hypothetical protein
VRRSYSIDLLLRARPLKISIGPRAAKKRPDTVSRDARSEDLQDRQTLRVQI